jgi:hypothetical protein
MVDTVLSMARSMVGGAINKAASAAADEMSLLMGVRKDIWYVCMNFLIILVTHLSTPSCILIYIGYIHTTPGCSYSHVCFTQSR